MTTAAVFAAKWHDLAQTLSLPAALSDVILAELQAGYGETGRHYHTDRHIVSLLDRAVGLDFRDGEIAQLAIFFHDLVYDPLRNDNERRSAEVMTQRLSDHVSANKLDKATAIIEATASHQPTGDADTDLVLDLDMGILGQPWPIYETYARGVMAEYLPYTGEAAWRQARVALFIDPTLARGKIFITEPFKPFDDRAMENLRREKAWLSGDQPLA